LARLARQQKAPDAVDEQEQPRLQGRRAGYTQRVAGAGADAKRGVPGFCSHPQQQSLSAAAHDYIGQPDAARLANALATEERSRRDNAGD
jgi:hypothetical protein